MNFFKKNDNRIAGIVGTVAVHLLLLLALLFWGLRTVVPKDETGLEVDYGTDDMGEGLFEPAPMSAIEDVMDNSASEPASPPDVTPPIPEDQVTQDIEESLEVKAEKERKKAEELKRQEEIRKQKELLAKQERERKEKEAKAQKASSTAKNAFAGSTAGKGTDNNTKNQGIAGGEGNQGVVSGTPGAQNYTDGGGIGSSYSLSGRKIVGSVPRPAYNRNEAGIIVVTIEVDPSGKVLSAKAGAAGTTIGDATLRREAELAAKKAKFNANNGSQIQTGTITYKYILN
ncbi:MAG: TonB family protein [Paludibacteraceae bacterium]|nr:TonB family protein [Paludibacteraceae bacterium]